MTTEDKPMTVDQAADFLQIHEETIKARARTGEIRGYKPGRRWVFLKSDLMDYLKTTQPERAAKIVWPRHSTAADLKSAVKKFENRLGRRTEKSHQI